MQKSLDKATDDVALIREANRLLAAEDYDALEPIALRLVAAEPRQTLYRNLLYRIAEHRQDWDAAYAHMAWIAAQEPYHPYWLEKMAFCASCRGHQDEAMRWAKEAVRIAPGQMLAQFNSSLWRLQAGDWSAEVWKGYEHRRAYRTTELRTVMPEWDGSPLPDGTNLYVPCEQGFGDTIQKARFLARLWEKIERDGTKGAFITFEVQPELIPLFASLSGPNCRVVGAQQGGAFVGAPDAWVSLWRLPAILGGDTPENYGAACAIPYLFSEPAEQIVAEKKEFPNILHVGLCWRGNPNYPGDAGRSIHDVSVLKPLLALSLQGVAFHCLMPDVGRVAGERELMESFGVRCYNLPTFAETGKVIAACDAVITTCTSVAHLAGAMGAQTLLMLAKDADWRWLQDRTDCPLYPSFTLFRQSEAGDWAGVVERVGTAIEATARMEGGVN
jgi:hypothetical protein